MRKPKSMAKILAEAKKAVQSRKFIDTIDDDKPKEKVFNYFRFTEYCHSLADSNTNSHTGFIIRDIVMEDVDKNFNRNKPHKFMGLSCID